MPYIAGWNTPGFLPETEPTEFDTFEDAVGFLEDTVDRFWDEDLTDHADDVTDDDVDDVWRPVAEALATATPYSFDELTGDGRLIFWITATEGGE